MSIARDNPRLALKGVIGDTRLLGTVFTFLGCVPGAFFLQSGEPLSWYVQLFAVVCVVMLVGPGVWYVVATFYLRKLETWVIGISLRVATAQAASVAVMIGSAVLLSTGRFQVRMFVVPAFLAVFFLPALAALCFQMCRARNLIRTIDAAGHAFQPVNVVPALPATALPSEETTRAPHDDPEIRS